MTDLDAAIDRAERIGAMPSHGEILALIAELRAARAVVMPARMMADQLTEDGHVVVGHGDLLAALADYDRLSKP